MTFDRYFRHCLERTGALISYVITTISGEILDVKRVITTCLLAASCAAFVSSPAMAGKNYYRWVNERGHVVHSDRPPPQGVDYEVVSTISTETRQVEAEEGAVPAVTEQPKQAKNDPNAIPKLEPSIVKDPAKCEAARANLSKLDSKARIRMRDKNGEAYFLTPEQQEEQRQRAQDAIDAHCE